MDRRGWTREELLNALSLYYQIPFPKINHGNPAVVALATVIGRTPSAVALKLANFASLDPDLRERGVGGMKNISRADREIWNEFYGRWDALAAASIIDVETVPDLKGSRTRRVPDASPSGPTEIERVTRARRGQDFFRAAVLAAHDGQCCITGITSPALLRASHIVPWSKDEGLRLDPRNGLCLNALHDAAMDRGLITLSENLELRVSRRLRNEVPDDIYHEMFGSRDGSPIRMPARFTPSESALAYHRAKVFVA